MADSLRRPPWRPCFAARPRHPQAAWPCARSPFLAVTHVSRASTSHCAQKMNKCCQTPVRRLLCVLSPALRRFHKMRSSHRAPRWHKPPLGMLEPLHTTGSGRLAGHGAQTRAAPPSRRRVNPSHSIQLRTRITLGCMQALLCLLPALPLFFSLLFPSSPCRSTSPTNPAAPVMKTGC